MGYCTPADIASALGVTFTTAETAEVQHVIDLVSAWITSKTGISWTQVTGAVARFNADGEGEIQFDTEPVNAVSSVKDIRNNLELLGNCVAWDGMDTIYGLFSGQVVDVTYDYGYSAVPDDIKIATIEIVKNAYAGDRSAVQTLTIGDRIEKYAILKAITAGMAEAIINEYATTEETWRIGPRWMPPPLFGLPTL